MLQGKVTVLNHIWFEHTHSTRNRIVHDYGEVEFTIVYQTITEDIPDICKKLENL